MKSPALLDADQQAAITRLVERDHTLLIAGMGAGKTVIAATAVDELLEQGAFKRLLVVAPKKTLETTWPEELAGWSHLAASRWWGDAGYCLGTARQRAAVVNRRPTILLVNFENLAWLCEHLGGRLTEVFDALLVDESSKLKATGGVAFKKLRRHLPKFTWRVAMSGTPVSEDLTGLFGQMLIVDAGKTFGRNKQLYLDEYFRPLDYQRYRWGPRAGADAVIAARAAPYVYAVPDYTHTLPELTIETVPVEMPPEAWGQYRLLARESALDDVTAVNEAVLTGKLQQVAAGFVYTDDDAANGREARFIHEAKLEVLDELLADETPAIVVYWWLPQRRHLEALGIPLLDAANVARWNDGEIKVMGLHPRSAGHGLNLQRGGHRVIWLSPQWSRDMYDQVIARVWRRGQCHAVRVQVLVSTGTADELVMDRLDGKADYHARFLTHLDDAQR